MRALVSASARIAASLEEPLTLWELGEAPRRCNVSDLRYFFDGCGDALEVDVADGAELEALLQVAARSDRAVKHAAIMLDPDTPAFDKMVCAGLLEGAMDDATTADVIAEAFREAPPLSVQAALRASEGAPRMTALFAGIIAAREVTSIPSEMMRTISGYAQALGAVGIAGGAIGPGSDLVVLAPAMANMLKDLAQQAQRTLSDDDARKIAVSILTVSSGARVATAGWLLALPAFGLFLGAAINAGLNAAVMKHAGRSFALYLLNSSGEIDVEAVIGRAALSKAIA